MLKNYSPVEKANILKQHFIYKKPIHEILSTYKINNRQFEKWYKELIEHSEVVFKTIPSDGFNYGLNYDLVVSWFADIFKGKTLDILGIKSDPIKNVCSFKPVNIAISSGMVDIIFEDIYGKCYHLEEQRNMTIDDLYRFASQHFPIANQWNDKVTDIILISGKPYYNKRSIKTPNGLYEPIFIDFTIRDGFKRLEEIRKAVLNGNYNDILELVFVPLYGKKKNIQLAEEVVKLEIELCKKNIISEIVLAATLVMTNKILDQETLNKFWKELKMIDIFAFAHDKGHQEGREEGRGEGIIENSREMVLEALEESIGIIPAYIIDKINEIGHKNVLKGLHRQAIKCKEISHFEQMLTMATAKSNVIIT